MKHLLSLFALAAFLIPEAGAQVAGHEYYCWTGTLGNDISCDVRIEYDGDQLALGEIIYNRKKAEPSSIALYGTVRQTGKGLNFELFEFLPSGKNTGQLSLTLTDGQPEFFAWSSPDQKSRYNFNVKAQQAFPFDEVQTYFQPLRNGDVADGVYTSTGRFDASTPSFSRLELSRSSDNAYTACFVNTDTDDAFLLYSNLASPSRLFLSALENESKIEMRLFRNFAYVYVIADPEKNLEANGRLNNFYFLQPGEKVINWITYDEGRSARLTAARLINGKVSIYNNPKQVVSYGMLQEDDIMAVQGWVDLTNVKPGVKDIIVGDIGQDTNPVLGILNQDGTVQILTLTNSAPKGVTSPSEPLPDQKDIVRFAFTKPDEDEEMDYCTFYGVDRNGQYHEIHICHIDGDWEMQTFDSKGVHSGRAWLSISPEWQFYYNQEIGFNNSTLINHYGKLWYEGDDYDHFSYQFNKKNNSHENFTDRECDVKGTFKAEFMYEDETYYLLVTPIKGLQFEIPEKSTGKFKKVHVVG